MAMRSTQVHGRVVGVPAEDIQLTHGSRLVIRDLMPGQCGELSFNFSCFPMANNYGFATPWAYGSATLTTIGDGGFIPRRISFTAGMKMGNGLAPLCGGLKEIDGSSILILRSAARGFLTRQGFLLSGW